MGFNRFITIVLWVFLCILAGSLTLGKAPTCVPQDWTSISNYLDFGTCNWPSTKSPCGPAVQVAQQPPGQRAWPPATCTLKFSRTPWAPEIFPQERDSGWLCGTLWQRCTKIPTPQILAGNSGNSSTVKPNSTLAPAEPPIDCGGKVAGTAAPCPADGWICEPKSDIYFNSNCKSNGEDLVLDVSSMGYPNAIANSRVSTPQQCQEMCTLRTGCNTWNYCNSSLGCGWSCQDYLNKLPKKSNKGASSFWSTTGFWIVIGAAVATILIAVIVITLLICRRRQRNKSQRNAHVQNPLNAFTVGISDTQSVPPKSVSSATPADGTPHMGYPAESGGQANAQLPQSYTGAHGAYPAHYSSHATAAPHPDPMAAWNGPYVGHISTSVTTPVAESPSQGSLATVDSAGGVYPGQGQVNVVMGQAPAGAPILPSTATTWPPNISGASSPHPRRFQFTGSSEEGSQGLADSSNTAPTGYNPSSATAASNPYNSRMPHQSATNGRPPTSAGYLGANHIVLGN